MFKGAERGRKTQKNHKHKKSSAGFPFFSQQIWVTKCQLKVSTGENKMEKDQAPDQAIL